MENVSRFEKIHAAHGVVQNAQKVLLGELDVGYLIEHGVHVVLNKRRHNKYIVERFEIILGFCGQYHVQHFNGENILLHLGQFVHHLHLS